MLTMLSAPSNLGLRPPAPGSVPGCAKAPEALREAGLFRRFAGLGAVEAGVVLPGRYADDVRPGRLRNQEAIVDHARRLAGRLGRPYDDGDATLVLGGDCGILLGPALMLRERGRFGLVHLDGHTDFRHPGNSDACASLGGEALAAVVGRHWPAVSAVDGPGPYFRPEDVVHAGCRDDDEEMTEVRAVLAAVIPSSEILGEGVAAAAERILAVVARPELDGYWIHLDVDILDPAHMPAVDSPDPGGLAPEDLSGLLRRLAPGAAGAQVTIFDPDLDPHGEGAGVLTDVLVDGLGDLGTAT
ncbi:MAG: arginase family protein [Streptosporangiales bacterium]|nr:arginase family protein [Streptosporangiales bacterium]